MQREEARSIMALVSVSNDFRDLGTELSWHEDLQKIFFSELEDWLAAKAYRSMMAMKGETSPEAHAAAVKSDVTLHGRSFVFQDSTVGGSLDAGPERARGEAMMFGGEAR